MSELLYPEMCWTLWSSTQHKTLLYFQLHVYQQQASQAGYQGAFNLCLVSRREDSESIVPGQKHTRHACAKGMRLGVQCRYKADGSALLTPILLYGCHRHVAGSSLCTALYTFLPCPPKQSIPCCPTAVKVWAARAGGVVLPSLHRCQVMDSAQ